LFPTIHDLFKSAPHSCRTRLHVAGSPPNKLLSRLIIESGRPWSGASRLVDDDRKLAWGKKYLDQKRVVVYFFLFRRAHPYMYTCLGIECLDRP